MNQTSAKARTCGGGGGGTKGLAGQRDVGEGRVAKHRVVRESHLPRLRQLELFESLGAEKFLPSRVAVQEQVVHPRLLRFRRQRGVAQQQRPLGRGRPSALILLLLFILFIYLIMKE